MGVTKVESKKKIIVNSCKLCEKKLITKPERVASDEMITFLVLNTAGVTLLPTTVISIRKSYGSKTPTDFVLYAIISTFAACVFGLLADKILRKPYKVKI